MYSGTPQHLPIHLSDCGIICNENQVPIETLITIGSKGFDNKTIVELRDKTTSETKESIERRINETKPKLIKHRNKRFYSKDIYLLLERGFTEFIAYKYKRMALDLCTVLSIALLVTVVFPSGLGKYDDCILLNQTNDRSCMEQIDIDHKIDENIMFIATSSWIVEVTYCMLVVLAKITKLRLFENEHQNS